MEDLLEQIETEAAKLLNTIAVIRALKPITRQQDACLGLVTTHIDALERIVGAEVHTGTDDKATQAKGAESASGVDLTGNSGVGPAAQA